MEKQEESNSGSQEVEVLDLQKCGADFFLPFNLPPFL
uniref:Uncharacterized protein n=1 Tax=Coprothermobacter proteolyticus (strain ATCC 35245 / DSM 5265 / OCM 4 / BT) TaxID=309798 RepID=B5Y9Y9_COPPD